MDIFIWTFRAASTQVLCFAWMMAVVQRVNRAVIFPATLKATELTDSHTDSCGSLTTRAATSWTVRTGVMWWRMMPSHHHIYQISCDQREAAGAFALMLSVKTFIFCGYESLRMLWGHRMLQNDAGAAVLPRFVSMCIPCRLRAKSKIGIQQCVGLS